MDSPHAKAPLSHTPAFAVEAFSGCDRRLPLESAGQPTRFPEASPALN
jgi:hypothetical protein